jgi:GT2 family glycosyltransferase/tetratricopeptide (TPR) repeat protein
LYGWLGRTVSPLARRLTALAANRARDAGRLSDAAGLYRKALRWDPARTDLRVQLANMLKDTGRWDEAGAAYRQALLERPDDADIHLQLGRLLKTTGHRGAAIAEFRAAAGGPSRAPALTELALIGEVAAQAELTLEPHESGGDALSDAVDAPAFPAGAYPAFRRVWDAPAPPRSDLPPLTVVARLQGVSADAFERLRAALSAQSLGRFQALLIADEPVAAEWADSAARADPRFVLAHDAPTIVAAAGRAEHDVVLLLEGGAVPHPHALAWVAWAAANTQAAAFVCDAERTLADGAVQSAELRCAVDAEVLQQANPYGDTLALIRSRCGAELDARDDATAASSAELLSALAGRGVGHIPYPLVALPGDRQRLAPGAAARSRPFAPILDAAASIAVAIPTRDNGLDAQGFVVSLRALASQPGRLRIVVLDNGTVDAASLQALSELAAEGVDVRRVDEPFNWSRLSNLGARASDADLLVFANDDMRMLTAGWDERLIGLLRRPDVGIVGAKLLYPDETIQHAGVLFGWRGGSIHDGLYEPREARGPGDRWRLRRRVAAVTGAFLATRRATFEAIGGYDEQRLAVSYSDLDLCLKARRLGLAVLYAPEIELVHHESKSRGLTHLRPDTAERDRRERAALEARWPGELDHDITVHPAWLDAGLPFQLLSPPTREACIDHLLRTVRDDPWAPVAPTEDPPRGAGV